MTYSKDAGLPNRVDIKLLDFKSGNENRKNEEQIEEHLQSGPIGNKP